MRRVIKLVLKDHEGEYLLTNKHHQKLSERTDRKIVDDCAHKAHLTVHVTPHTPKTYLCHTHVK